MAWAIIIHSKVKTDPFHFFMEINFFLKKYSCHINLYGSIPDKCDTHLLSQSLIYSIIFSSLKCMQVIFTSQFISHLSHQILVSENSAMLSLNILYFKYYYQ
jgi:hypothetical protein